MQPTATKTDDATSRYAAAAATRKACGVIGLTLLVLLQLASTPLSMGPLSSRQYHEGSPWHSQRPHHYSSPYHSATTITTDGLHTASISPSTANTKMGVLPKWGSALLPSLLSAEAAYFFVHEGQDKCFIESVPVGVPLTVSYKNTENPGVPCNIIYKDPHNRPVYSREVPSSETEGKLSYMTTTTGEYKVCISCTGGNKWLGATLLKWSVSIELGDTDINLDELAKREQVDSLQVKMQSISGRLEAMQKENDYERTHEERHQKTCEDTNSRIVWFSVLQLLLLCGTTHISVFYLVRYFQSQKVI